jgi:hypothetical protein
VSEPDTTLVKSSDTDVDHRVARAQRVSNGLFAVGALLLVTAAPLDGGASAGSAALGVTLLALGWRVRKNLSAVGAIRRATEANARGDDAASDALLMAELRRATSPALRLPILELLSRNAWRRGEPAAICALFERELRGVRAGEFGPLADAHTRLRSLWLLASALTEGSSSVKVEADRLEALRSVDGRAMTRIALARAVAALDRGDRAGAVSALRGFSSYANEALSEERALGRALLRLATSVGPADGYRGAAMAPTGSTMAAWVGRVCPQAAPMVESLALRPTIEPAWSREPAIAPLRAPDKQLGRRPALHMQRFLLFVSIALLVAGSVMLTTQTELVALALVLSSVATSVASLLARGWRGRVAKRELALLQEATRERLRSNPRAAVERAESVAQSSREAGLSASAALQLVELSLVQADLDGALRWLDEVFGRVAWLPRGGKDSLPWANAVLWRPMLLAMAGRREDAEGALAFALRSVIEQSAGRGLRFATRLWLAIATGAREEAIEIARTFDGRMSLDGRTELARDAALSLGDPAAAALIRARLLDWPDGARLLERVGPWLCRALEDDAGSTGVRVEVDTPTADEHPTVAHAPVAVDPADDQGRGGSTP